MVVEFAGASLEEQEASGLVAVVEPVGDQAAKIKIQGINVQQLPEKRWRVSFQITPSAENGKLADVGPLELRCFLKKGEDFLTETWIYRVIP